MAKQKQSQNIIQKFRDSESSTSVIFGAIVVIVVGILLVNYFKSNKVSPQISEQSSATESAVVSNIATNGFTQPSKLPTTYVVVHGDHLWGIAEKFYGSGYNDVDIAQANKNSDHLIPGMTLNIPDVTAKQLTVKTTQITGNTQAANPVVSGQTISGTSYVVAKGDCLWTIAVRAYGDGYKWATIWNANKNSIKDPGMIDVGWQLTLPR